jgi:biopolymer transport protein ExbB/TolQ
MDQQTLLIVMTVFVIVSAIALLIQAGLLFAIFKSTRAVEQHAERLMPKVEALVETSRIAVEGSRREIAEVALRTNAVLDTTRRELERVDDFLGDVTDRARIQMDRAEMVLDDAMNRTQETVALVHSGVMKPLRQIEGITAGIQAALRYLMRGRGNHPPHATVDEEMFI